MRRLPGYRWRILAWRNDGNPLRIERDERREHPTCIDELVIDDWLHLEQMAPRRWWVQIGDMHINVHIPAKGKPVVTWWMDEAPKPVEGP